MIQYVKNYLPAPKKQKTYKYKKKVHNEVIITFDIETSTGFLPEGCDVPVPFDFSKPKSYYRDLEKVNIVYIWMACIDGVTYYHRDFSMALEFFKEVQEVYDGELIVWVHNLSYEFQHLLDLIPFERVFARTAHKVIYAEWEHIQFRCTYFLTHKSLYHWAKDARLPVQKAKDDLDYLTLRTPKSTLNETELHYCEADVLVVYHGVMQYVEKYKRPARIPLTQTGEVRKVVKKLAHDTRGWTYSCAKQVPRDASEYARQMLCFAGGYTHTNYKRAGTIWHHVHSKDISSSYPTQMVLMLAPMGPWYKMRPQDFRKYYNDGRHCVMLDVTFKGIQSVLDNDYIAFAKCYSAKGARKDNGRIIDADELSMVITDVDFSIIEEAYQWDEMVINEAWQCIGGSLPKQFIEYILDLYEGKTKLKGLDEEYSNYMMMKQFINSLYGMCVTAIIQENINFDGESWETEVLDPEEITKKLQEKAASPWSNFVAYHWGVWVTAYARRQLWDAIIALDKDVIYCDTDSVKYIGDHDDFFEEYNRRMMEKVADKCKRLGIDPKKSRPKDIKGNEHPLGIYDKEPTYKEFIALGAKRYAYLQQNEDGVDEIHITVSGVNKELGAKQLKSLKEFKPELVFDYKHSGKLISEYLSDMPAVTWNKGEYDEYVSHQKHGIALYPTTYSMEITDEYLDLIMFDQVKRNMDVGVQELHRISKGE